MNPDTVSELIQAIFGECIGTFVIVHFVLCQVHKTTTYTEEFVLLGVLFWIILYGCMQFSYKSGSVYNPAIAFGLYRLIILRLIRMELF